jgi:magnesium chelatase family protein
VALGVLAATEQVPCERLARVAAIGELALDGRLRGVRGTLGLAESAWRAGATSLLCAAVGAPVAALVEGLAVLPVATVNDALREPLETGVVNLSRASPQRWRLFRSF